MTDTTATTQTPRRPVRRGTVVIAILGALVFLGVGATLGVVLAPGQQADPAAPNAVDVGFAQDMIVHHRQGVQMAHLAEQNTDDPADMIGVLAYDIDATQLVQVGIMQGWLQLWGKPELNLGETMGWMSTDGGHGDHGGAGGHGAWVAEDGAIMPGMATNAEITELKSLRGVESDKLFLQLMIRHHLGGVPMMEYAVEHANVPAVRTLAQQMLSTQTAEVSKMTQMLAELGGEPLPFDY